MTDEKREIERGTAEGFLILYNKHFGTTFRVAELSDAPDVRCIDDIGGELNLEITTTEDAPRDIQALLGRSDHKSIEALVEHNDRVAQGLKSPQLVSFDDAESALVSRIAAKCENDYGRSTALVIRDSSGCDWEWDEAAAEIALKFGLRRNPFDRGVWLLTRTRDKLFQLVEPTNG